MIKLDIGAGKEIMMEMKLGLKDKLGLENNYSLQRNKIP